MSAGVEAPYVGRAMRRKEDPRMITGRARYVDDIAIPGTLWIAIVRSTEAHAKIISIDKSVAAERNDVVAVFTGEDLVGDFAAPMAMVWSPPGVEIKTPHYWPVARGEVKHVGDPVAVVVGNDRYSVIDAAEDVSVEYEPIAVVLDPEKALEDGSPLVWEQFGTNKTHEWKVSGGDIEAALADADVVIEQRMVNHRTAGGAIETRGVLADPGGDKITLHSSTQVPHILRFVLSLLLGMHEDNLRVVAPDVGGGFGSKLQVYPEEVLAVALAKRLNRPVKWIETRSEAMMATHHGRDQINYVTLAAKQDGTLTGCRARIVADLGAYQLLLTPFIPELGFPVMGGCYRIPAIDLT
ncbi:MAG TPA: molybdopterin cofactor-binding domain-containing protein, partial [Solirubrobacteraceae bacterium]